MGLLEKVLRENKDDVRWLVDNLNFKEKVDRSLGLIKEAYEKSPLCSRLSVTWMLTLHKDNQ